jgi:hypothetical protein
LNAPWLVPDCGGLIAEVAMTLPPFLLAPQQAAKRRALGNLAEALPAGIALILLAEEPTAVTVEDWAAGLRLRCALHIHAKAPAGTMRDADLWTQDTFLAAEHDGANVLLPLPHTDHPGQHAQWLTGATRRITAAPPIHLAGGNILTGADFRLVGAASVEHTARVGDRPMTSDEALARHRALDERPLHLFGFPLPTRDMPQPLAQQPHHLDLVLSLTGKITAAGKHLLLLADPRGTLDPDGPRVPGWAEQLDATAERLEADGFAVLRNKVPYLSHPAYAPNPSLRAYNNVMLENAIRTAKSRPLVWLPHFGDLEPDLGVYDDANRAVWESLGFEVVPVPGWSPLVRAGGALRCASKVLRRGVAPAPILT